MRTVTSLPSTIILYGCKLTFHLRRVARKLWERLLPLIGPLPLAGHVRDIRHHLFFMLIDITIN